MRRSGEGSRRENFNLLSGKMEIEDAHADSEYNILSTSSFEFHHTQMRGKNEDGGPHAASTPKTFPTRRAIPIGGGLKRRSWRGSDYP